MPSVASVEPSFKERDLARSLADRDWWQSLLPPGWVVFGWTYRSGASARHLASNRYVELDARLLCDMRGLDYEKEWGGGR